MARISEVKAALGLTVVKYGKYVTVFRSKTTGEYSIWRTIRGHAVDEIDVTPDRREALDILAWHERHGGQDSEWNWLYD